MVRLDKLTVLPNGVDTDEWRPDASVREAVRRKLGLKNEFLWLAVGRLEPVKDYATLLAAMAGVPKSVQLVIAGAGPLQDELQRQAERLDLKCRVRFLGFEPDVRPWLQATDGFVLSSRWEGLPMGLLEAAACGVPAVATDVPGTREVIVNGQTGWLTPAGDAAALGDRMATMMRISQQERSARGERARRQVLERFSLGAVLDKWETLYTDLLDGRLRKLAGTRLTTIASGKHS